MRTPPIVSPQEWEAALQRMRVKEKEQFRARDALAAERRHMPWYTILPQRDGSAFDTDFGVDEWHGTNAFIHDGDRVFRTYFINGRGDEALGTTWSFLDMTALGRQEEWEDSPEGYPQTPPYEWWDWHDTYGKHTPSRWFGDPDPDNPNDIRPPRK
jgi:predicted dithiol-disulfide oxidoreductase (DUF899 family)